MKIAYCSPLPPQPSGIADYSAELLPVLAEHVDGIELFVAGDSRPEPRITERFPVRPLGELAARAPELDAVLYHLGNDVRFHGEIYRAALEVPGVVVLHEYMLHHLVRGLTVDRHDPEGYVAAMERCYGRGGACAGRRFLDIGAGIERWFYPMFEELADSSRGVIAHNRCTRDRVLAARPDAAVAVVPHHLCLDALPDAGIDRQVARQRLGLPSGVLLVGVFGFLTASKRLAPTLVAFQRLRAERPDARLLLVGDPGGDPELPGLLAGGLADGVELVGRVPLDHFLLHMRAVDVAVNLRWPTGGETSGTVMRLLGLGLPTVVSDVGAFAEIPDGCCVKVPVGEHEVEALAAALLVLADDPELRARLGGNARGHMAESHTLDGSARGYAAALRELGARPPLHPRRGRAVEHAASASLVAEVGAALLDLGVGEGDLDLLGEAAAALRDLDVR